MKLFHWLNYACHISVHNYHFGPFWFSLLLKTFSITVSCMKECLKHQIAFAHVDLSQPGPSFLGLLCNMLELLDVLSMRFGNIQNPKGQGTLCLVAKPPSVEVHDSQTIQASQCPALSAPPLIYMFTFKRKEREGSVNAPCRYKLRAKALAQNQSEFFCVIQKRQSSEENLRTQWESKSGVTMP